MSHRTPTSVFIAVLTSLIAFTPTFARDLVSDKDRDGRAESAPQVRLHQDPARLQSQVDDRHIVLSIPSPAPNGQGLTFDGTYLWAAGIPSGVVHQVDPANGNSVNFFATPGQFPEGLAWDGTYLWVADNDGSLGGVHELHRMDPTTGALLNTVSGPTSWMHGITWDGENLWAANFGDGTIEKIDHTNGDVLLSISAPTTSIIGLTWDGTYLWTDDISAKLLYQLDPSDGSVIKTIPSPHLNPRDLAWDGRYLWVLTGSDGNTIYQLDPEERDIACVLEHTAQTHGTTSGGSPQGVGQTFTACETGVITRVVVETLQNSNSEATFGISLTHHQWVPVYTQEVVLHTGNTSYITLDVPFPVVQGQKYSFGLIEPAGGQISLGAGGNGYLGGNSAFIIGVALEFSEPFSDLTFEIIIERANDTPPELTVEVDPDVLWPPNHKMVDVHASITVTDDVDPNPSVVLSSITCNGSAAADCVEGADYGTADVDFQLRAERSGKGNGRTYEITYEAVDASGNSSTVTVYVEVPHDQRSAGPQRLWSGDDEMRPITDRLSAGPNPFNPNTTIRFYLENAGPAALRVYDVNGAMVRTLHDATLPSGIHEVRWNGVDHSGTPVSSGVYFVRLIADGSSVTRKLVLLK